MKTHVLLCARYFLKDHPKAGEPTDFRNKILGGQKLHTLRSNYDYWAPKIQEVAEGKARLSLRQWRGKPYRSNQATFLKITKVHNPGFQKVRINKNVPFVHPRENKNKIISDTVTPGIHILAENDGLEKLDFINWFDQPFEGIIIHFTNFRY